LAGNDIIWEASFRRDFGEPPAFLAEQEISWKEKYHNCSETPTWDPALGDDPIVFENNNRTSKRQDGGMFSKAFMMHPVSMQRSHTIHLTSNRRFTVGFFSSPSKKELHEIFGNKRAAFHELFNIFPGRATILTLYGGVSVSLKKDEGQASVVKDEQEGADEIYLEFNKPVDLKMHIHAKEQKVRWEINGSLQLGLSLLPYPAPIWLVYQSGEPFSTVVIEGVKRS